jgi:hypothetical protein
MTLVKDEMEKVIQQVSAAEYGRLMRKVKFIPMLYVLVLQKS